MMAVLPDMGPHGRSTRAGGGNRADQQATDQERDKA
jgi:hypothetical protein